MKLEDKTLEYLLDQMELAGIDPKLDHNAEWLREAIRAYIQIGAKDE